MPKIEHTVQFYRRVGKFVAVVNKLNLDMSEGEKTMVAAKKELLAEMDQLKTDLTG